MSTEAEEPLRKNYYVGQKQMFEELGDGTVRVTDAAGRTGVFHWDGRFIEGELTTVNTHMLRYVGGPRPPHPFKYRWTDMVAEITSASGWPEEQEKALEQLRRSS